MRLARSTRFFGVLAAAAIAGVGAGTYAALGSGEAASREATVASAESAAVTTTLSVSEIYRRTHEGVVEITVESTGSDSSPFGDPQNQQARTAVVTGFRVAR